MKKLFGNGVRELCETISGIVNFTAEVVEVLLFTLFITAALVMVWALADYAANNTIRNNNAQVSVAPKVEVFNERMTFVVAEEVKQVEGFDMGRVILMSPGEKRIFSAMVVPMRRIPVGSAVKMDVVTYRTGSNLQSAYFTVVK